MTVRFAVYEFVEKNPASTRHQIAEGVYGVISPNSLRNVSMLTSEMVARGSLRKDGVVYFAIKSPVATHTAARQQQMAKELLEPPATPEELAELQETPRPRVRLDCLPGGMNMERPCPFVSCRYHLAIEGFRLNGLPRVAPGWETRETCVLDAVDAAGWDEMTLEAVGGVMNLTRERVRQIEEKACRRVVRPACQIFDHTSDS